MKEDSSSKRKTRKEQRKKMKEQKVREKTPQKGKERGITLETAHKEKLAQTEVDKFRPIRWQGEPTFDIEQAHTLLPPFDGNLVDNFFGMFEKIAKESKWSKEILFRNNI